MPRDGKLIADVLQAVEDNNFQDVKYIFETKFKKKDKSPFSLFCVLDGEKGLQKDLENVILAAAKLKDTKIIKYMIKNGASVNFLCEPITTIPQTHKTTRTSPLHLAVNHGLHDTIAILLENNANVNVLDHKQRGPLHIAVSNADSVATRMLLFRGADPHLLDASGSTALQIASKYGHVELVRILLDHNAQIFHESQKGPSPLHIAAIQGHVPIIDMYSKFVDVNIKVPCNEKKHEKAAIHLAAERGLVETVRFLLERFGADPNVLDSEDQTVLHCALLHKHDHRRMRSRYDYELMVDLLIKKGVDVNQQNKKGETALHLAAKHHFHKIADILHLANANTKLKNIKDQTPFDVIPEYDLQMKQIFARGLLMSSPYAPSRHLLNGSGLSQFPHSPTHAPVNSPLSEMHSLKLSPTNPDYTSATDTGIPQVHL